MLNYKLDGNQEEPVCKTCPKWKYGPEAHDGPYGREDDWSKVMCCWHGAYRPGFSGGMRVTHPNLIFEGAPQWCPRRLENYQCTCGRCPECKILHCNICSKCGVMHLGIRKECKNEDN